MYDQNLVIPKTQSEEEKALDRELEKLEHQLSSQLAPVSGVRLPRTPVPAPVKTKNWLTPTLLDPENTDDLSSERNETDWIRRELERQRAIQREKKALAEEEALVNKMLREGSPPNRSVESNPFKPYEPVLRNSLSPTDLNPASSYSAFSPSRIILPKEKEVSSKTMSRYSPAPRANSGIIKPAFSSPSSGQRTDWRPQFESSVPKPVSSSRSDWNDIKPKPLPPLKRVRHSSPIYREDPFDDDLVPRFKTSIWD